MWSPCITLLFIVSITAEKCPRGGKIYNRGVNDNEDWIVDLHNNYRLMIAHGGVPGQPRGINLKRMSYDEKLGDECRVVSNQCLMNHILTNDNRFPNGYVGQNIFIEYSSEYSEEQNWDSAVEWWFNENTKYSYPNGFAEATGHYTQVVWADTNLVGCDYIFYYDNNNQYTPYTKMYTCNYGPGGNFNNNPPYKTGRYGCYNLC